MRRAQLGKSSLFHVASVELAGARGLRCIGIHSPVLVPQCFLVSPSYPLVVLGYWDEGRGVGNVGKGSM